MKTYDKYTFFWNGPFSQWEPSNFRIDGVTYNCAEQYMMVQKALAFNDFDSADQIRATHSPSIQKAIGRQVKGFNAGIWSSISRDVVFRGNCAKFSQNPELMGYLMETEETLIVEASPFDRIWGIGLDESAAKKITPDKWMGLNWLGQVLTEVRELFEYFASPTAKLKYPVR